MDQDLGLPDVWRVLVAHKVNRPFASCTIICASVDEPSAECRAIFTCKINAPWKYIFYAFPLSAFIIDEKRRTSYLLKVSRQLSSLRWFGKIFAATRFPTTCWLLLGLSRTDKFVPRISPQIHWLSIADTNYWRNENACIYLSDLT